jgi:hypothetical protein
MSATLQPQGEDFQNENRKFRSGCEYAIHFSPQRPDKVYAFDLANKSAPLVIRSLIIHRNSVMNKSMLWTIASILTLSGLAVFAYLLWKKTPITAGSFDLGDLTNMATLVVAVFSLYIAEAAYQKSVMDSEEQQKSLDASRAQLQAVVDAATKQQEVLSKNLETSKAQLALLEKQWEREQERASRKPKLQILIDEHVFDKYEIETDLTVGQNRRAVLLTGIKNIGSDLFIDQYSWQQPLGKT